MENLYHNLICEFRHTLNAFRNRLLLSDFLRCGILLLAFVMVYLLIFHFFSHFFNLSSLFRFIGYFLFYLFIFFLLSRFLFYPLVSFFISFNLKKDILLRRILVLFPSNRDDLLSLYNFAFHTDKITGDHKLKEAAFIQKYDYLRQHGVSFRYPSKVWLRELTIFLLLSLMLIVNGSNFSHFYRNLSAYENSSDNRYKINFELLNKSLNVEYGKPFRLELRVTGERFLVENVFVCFGGGEFLMDKNDSLYVYDFEAVNNDIKLYFKTADIESRSYRITVLPTPEITDYKVICSYPAYTGLKAEIYKNLVDFKVIYGSSLKFEIDYSDLDTLFFGNDSHLSVVPMKSSSATDFTKSINSSGEYSLYGSNKNFIRKNLLNFSITCMPDLYPGIEITEMQDSTRNSIHYFYGIITDDYGFSDLHFNFSVNGHANTVMPVEIVRNVNNQEFYFSFDFAEFAGMDKAQVRYYFEIFDNDIISGPKSTRSDSKDYVVPDLNTIFDYNLQVNNNVNSSLKEAEKLAKEIVSGVKELQRKMLDNNSDNWEKQQLSKDIIDKKNKLDKLLQNVKEDNRKKLSLNQSFTKQDSLLIDKQKQLQQLMDKVMDDEMKKLMEEFSKLSDEFSKKEFQNLDEKMKMSFDQMSEELDRNIELLKRFQIEERHDMLSAQLEKLKADQQKFEDAANDRSLTNDSVAELSKQIKNNLENIKNNYNNLLKDNQDLSEPYQLKKQDQKFDDLSQKIEKQTQNSSDGENNKDLSEDIKDKIEELQNEMEQQKQSNFNNMSIPQNDIELIIQNILIISLSQEELLKEFPKVQVQSSRYSELGRLQDLKKQEYKIVKDSLSVLAKSNLMLASVLSDKFYDIEIKFGLLSGYIQDNKRADLLREQQYIVSYLNDMALSLTEALQKGKKDSKGSKGGKGGKPGDKPGGDKEGTSSGKKDGGYGAMKRMQDGIKKQLEDLVSKMKKGEQGKPLQQGISKMIRENELFRKSLNDFISESGSLSNGEKQLLNEINRLLEENIRDMANYSVSNHLIDRNNQIYNKLLISEEASKEREEYQEKRRSATVRESDYKRPETLFDFKKKAGFIRTDPNRSDIKLSSYFENMYNNYYIKLGNE